MKFMQYVLIIDVHLKINTFYVYVYTYMCMVASAVVITSIAFSTPKDEVYTQRENSSLYSYIISSLRTLIIMNMYKPNNSALNGYQLKHDNSVTEDNVF